MCPQKSYDTKPKKYKNIDKKMSLNERRKKEPICFYGEKKKIIIKSIFLTIKLSAFLFFILFFFTKLCCLNYRVTLNCKKQMCVPNFFWLEQVCTSTIDEVYLAISQCFQLELQKGGGEGG